MRKKASDLFFLLVNSTKALGGFVKEPAKEEGRGRNEAALLNKKRALPIAPLASKPSCRR